MSIHPKTTLFFSAAVIIASGVLTALPARAQVIINEQFSGNAIDTSVFTTDNGNTIFGRTRLNSRNPTVQNGTLQLELQSFNPIDPGSLFLADELRTIRTFAPSQSFGFSFETRARFVDDANNPLSPGVIGGAFLFGVDSNFPVVNERDEIDFELLSNNPQGQITTNIFNDQDFSSGGDFVVSSIPGLDLTQFNDFRIETQINSTRFFVNDQLIREETSNLALEPQDFRLNINAQGPEFGAAFSNLLQPTSIPGQNEINIFEVDSLVISQLPTDATTVIADFTTSTTAEGLESFTNLGTLSNNGYEISLAQTAASNFGLVAETNDNLVTQGFFIDADTQLLIEATPGQFNDTDFVVAVREDSGEFFSIAVSAEDLNDNGQAVVNLSDFFFTDGPGDGIINGTIVEVSFQTPFGSGNAVDFAVQRISVFNGSAIPEPTSATLVFLGGVVGLLRRSKRIA